MQLKLYPSSLAILTSTTVAKLYLNSQAIFLIVKVSLKQSSVQPGCFSHAANNNRLMTEQPGYSRNAATTVQTVSELPGYSSHATQSEQFYHEIADEELTSASPVTQEHPVQLPRLVHTRRLG
jgi:hypothetical protein